MSQKGTMKMEAKTGAGAVSHGKTFRDGDAVSGQLNRMDTEWSGAK